MTSQTTAVPPISCGQRLDPVAPPGGAHHVEAVAGQRAGRGRADPAAGSGDDGGAGHDGLLVWGTGIRYRVVMIGSGMQDGRRWLGPAEVWMTHYLPYDAAPAQDHGLRRVAMVSLHTSPLDQPGTGDAGGMNVYVLELARRLAARQVEVDVFTRSTASALPPVVDVSDGIRVHHVSAGPFEGLTKHELPAAAVRLRPRGAAHRGLPLARLLRPRAQPLLAQRPGRRAGPRPVGRPAGAHDAHDGEGQERRARRGRHPRADGAADRRGAGGRRRRHARGQHRRRGPAADRPVRRRPRPRRGGAPRRRPDHLPRRRDEGRARAPRPGRRRHR